MAKHSVRQGTRSASRARRTRNIVLVVVGVVLALAAVCGFLGYRFYREALQVRDHELAAVQALQGLQDSEQLKDTDALNEAVAQAQEHASAAKEITDGGLWKAASFVPVVGDDVKTVRGMVDVVDGVVGQTLPVLASTMQNLMGAELSGGKGQLNLQPIIDAQDGLIRANELMQEQASAIEDLPTPHIGMVRSAYEQGRDQLTKVADMLDGVSGMVQVAPKMLGADGSRTYLLVAQTTSEQRSGGGLVGSLGTMHTEQGKISVGDFHSNTEFISLGESANDEEHDVFSAPLRFSMDIRDLFAVPDISRVAEMLDNVWQKSEYACPLDGIIVIDPVFIQEMVRINGDITLDNGYVLTGENTAEFMLNSIYKCYEPQEQDGYFEYVAASVMDGAFSNMTTDKMLQVVQAMGSLAENRHFYAYTFHEDEAQYFQDGGLAKSVPSSESEPEVGIYLNEQHGSKMGWYITREGTVTKTSCNGDGSRTYHVTYTLANTITDEELQTATDYILGPTQNSVGSSYVMQGGTSVQRMLFYAPAGGTITDFTSTGNVQDQVNKTMDGKELITNVAYLEPGTSVTYEFNVTTSPKAASDLKIDQSPAGWLESGITYDVDECPAE